MPGQGRRSIGRSILVLEALAGLRRLKWRLEHAEARVEFALRHTRRETPLSEEQIERFRREGCLFVPALVPESIARRAGAAMWETLGADERRPETWSRIGPYPHELRDERLVATYTDAMLAAGPQLAGVNVAAFLRPRHTLAFNNLPVDKAWEPHEPHIDRIIPDMRYRVSPRPYWIGALTYLSEVPPHGGGTIVWPGSHLKLQALVSAEPVKYRYLAALNDALDQVDLGPGLEVTASPGDVLFHHHLCVHAASDNLSGTPRLAIDHKW